MKKRAIREETQVKSQIEFGLDRIDENEAVEVNLKQLLLICKTLQELERFFYNRDHYQTIEQVYQYMGSNRKGVLAMLHHTNSNAISAMLPASAWTLLQSESLRNPDLPYYVALSDLR